MTKFALKKLDQVKGQIPFTMLEVDGKCQFEEFCAQILQDGNLKNQLVTAIARMGEISNMKLLPVTKFRNITPQWERVKEFEIKTHDLRIYLIKEDGHIIILGGKKNNQDGDIRKFRSIKQRYLQSKK